MFSANGVAGTFIRTLSLVAANPATVKQAIAKVIAMMVSLIGTIKAVNNAADLAENGGANATIEAINYSKKHNISLSGAKSIISIKESYDSQINSLYEERQKSKTDYDKYKKQWEENYEGNDKLYAEDTGILGREEMKAEMDRLNNEMTKKLSQIVELISASN